jgi:hypothetical protein
LPAFTVLAFTLLAFTLLALTLLALTLLAFTFTVESPVIAGVLTIVQVPTTAAAFPVALTVRQISLKYVYELLDETVNVCEDPVVQDASRTVRMSRNVHVLPSLDPATTQLVQICDEKDGFPLARSVYCVMMYASGTCSCSHSPR